MEAYTDFADVYDIFMDETPYEQWADFLAGLIRQYGVSRTTAEMEEAVETGETAKMEEAAETGETAKMEEAVEMEEAAKMKKTVETEETVKMEEAAEMEKTAKMEKTAETERGTAGREDALLTERNLVLDLGCGTGTLTELLAGKGYDMIGVDVSQEMLSIALDKKEKSGSSILYLCQDMRELDLYSTVGTVLSVCDSVNYLLDDEDVVTVFSLVNNYLYPGGIFIFDFNTIYKYEQVIGDATIAENRETCSFIWENYYHQEQHVNEYDLTIFNRTGTKGLYRRFTETHFQRGYTKEEMIRFVELAGMKAVLLLDADTHKAPTETSERIYVIAREDGK